MMRPRAVERWRKEAVVIMTRAPKPGATKTRMMPEFTGDQCARAHACFIRDTVRACSAARADIYIAYTPEENRLLLDRAVAPLNLLHLGLFEQQGNGLGERLHYASSLMFKRGYAKWLLLGSDAPEITPALLDRALGVLDGRDAVMGPTDDGGYYLIGLKRPNEKVFSLSEYGHSRVFDQTIALLSEEGLTWGLLPSLQDIDTFEDACGLLNRVEAGCSPGDLESASFLRAVIRKAGKSNG